MTQKTASKVGSSIGKLVYEFFSLLWAAIQWLIRYIERFAKALWANETLVAGKATEGHNEIVNSDWGKFTKVLTYLLSVIAILTLSILAIPWSVIQAIPNEKPRK